MKSQYLRSQSPFFARRSPEWTSASSKAWVSGALPLIPQRALTSLSPPALCLRLDFPTGSEMSLVQFLSFGRGQRGGTPVGFTLGRKKKYPFFTFLFFTSFVPPFHPYLAKVKEIVFWHLPQLLLPVVVNISRGIVMQKSKNMDIVGRSIPAFILLHTSTVATVSKNVKAGVSE